MTARAHFRHRASARLLTTVDPNALAFPSLTRRWRSCREIQLPVSAESRCAMRCAETRSERWCSTRKLRLRLRGSCGG